MKINRDANGVATHVGGALKDVIMTRAVEPPLNHRPINAMCLAVEAWFTDNRHGSLMIVGNAGVITLEVGGTRYTLPDLREGLPLIIIATHIADPSRTLWGSAT